MTGSQRAETSEAGDSRADDPAGELAAAARIDPLRWPDDLADQFEDSLAERQYELGRFLLWMGLAVAIATIAVDFVAIPSHAPIMLVLRLVFVVPLQVAALLMPPRLLGMQKLLMGLSIVSFAGILLLGVQWAPPLTGGPSEDDCGFFWRLAEGARDGFCRSEAGGLS